MTVLTEPLGRSPHGVWTELGSERVDDGEGGTVHVSHCDMPARFWRFTIERDNGVTTVLETGSGRLSEYLPIARLFASGMLTVAR